ncbi:hypothetical protein [Kineococcus aurantiacus]|uniref:DUF4253 domain-containing protein n=1 Tax=Kineococcus aurantiacus TaxID=37633 RepID=A0A7Y9DLS3_9ACTN|nr:hypothetical protein [Kineococcus aurantiacus]NYD22918.1 hypothetical protein [Kineococcus aurantiacus]
MSHPVSLACYGELQDCACPREALEHGLRRPGDLVGYRDEWRRVLDRARAGDWQAVMNREADVNLVLPPEGTSWERWAEWVDLRLTEVAADPSTVAPLPLHRSSSLVREGLVDPEEGETVRAVLGDVLLPEIAGRRDYLVLEAPRDIGVSRHLDRGTGRVSEVPTRRIGVVLEHRDGVRVVGVHAADAVPLVDVEDVRRRWPVLAAALGGWFNDALLVGEESAWSQQVLMLEQETDERLDLLATEITDLLTLHDADVHAVVASAGCYVEPVHLRLWLQWMAWRIGYFDWK